MALIGVGGNDLTRSFGVDGLARLRYAWGRFHDTTEANGQRQDVLCRPLNKEEVMRWITLIAFVVLVFPVYAQENEAEKLYKTMEKEIRSAKTLHVVVDAKVM